MTSMAYVGYMLTTFLILVAVIAIFVSGYLVGSKNPASKVEGDVRAKFEAEKAALVAAYEAKIAELRTRLSKL